LYSFRLLVHYSCIVFVYYSIVIKTKFYRRKAVLQYVNGITSENVWITSSLHFISKFTSHAKVSQTSIRKGGQYDKVGRKEKGSLPTTPDFTIKAKLYV